MKIFGVTVDKRFVATALLGAAVVAATRFAVKQLPSNQLTEPVKKVASLV